MKKQTIHISSLARSIRVRIQNGTTKPRVLKFKTEAEAIDYILPRSNRQTEMYLNGYLVALAGWYQ
ncbi:MAG TPA: hypothetical protein P5555_07315 [Candidatus Paceibacterota bacterium]|nr:hypothetical protein [Verrucomicrobiota bacterium]HRZ44985.1 hypothetical protein [Candidatus Paceibacterota bacterium]HRZ99343.1 hypothetical protein [Candidatus Paceibacterota bacterium]